jgi:hypothetical protein
VYGEAIGHDTGPTAAERGERTHDEVGAALPQGRSEGARDFEAIGFGGGGLELVGDIGEDDQAFEVVIAIFTPTGNVQRQIDLGRRRLNDRLGHKGRYSVAVPGVRPSMSFGPTRSATLPTESTDFATFHWNCASSLRPAFQ